MGRKKVEMKVITDKSSQQVTFSKRRTGLFKKAYELSSLCSAETAVVVFSPGGKAFSFGYPDVNSVLSRFLNRDVESKSVTTSDGTPDEIGQKLADIQKQLEIEKKRGVMLRERTKNEYKITLDELGLEELQNLKGSMEELGDGVESRINEMEAASSLLLLADREP